MTRFSDLAPALAVLLAAIGIGLVATDTGVAAGLALVAAGTLGLGVMATGRGRRESRMRRLVDRSPDALVAVDGSGRVVAASGAVEALLGQDLPPGLPLAQVIPGFAEAGSPEQIGTARNGVREVVVRSGPGQPRWLEVAVTPADDGGVTVLSFRDGAARRAADETLRRKLREMEINTRMLREIERLGRIGCYEFLPGAKEAHWSRELDRIFSLDPDESGQARSLEAVMSRVHPDDLPDILSDAQDQSWKERERVFRIVRPDGAVRHVYSRSYREFGPDGRVTRLTGIDQDVTDRIEVEAALRAQADMLRRLFDDAPVPLTVGDANGRYLAVNRRAAALLEVAEPDLPHLRAEDFYVDPTARAVLMGAATREGQVSGFDVELQTRTGRRFWATLSASPVRYDGRPALLCGFVDIDARRRAEATAKSAREDLRRLLKAVPVPMVVARLSDGRLLFANDLAARQIDCTAEGAVGLGVVGHYHDPADFHRIRNSLIRNRKVENEVIRLRDQPDGPRWALVSAKTVEFEGEDAAMGVAVDITSRHLTAGSDGAPVVFDPAALLDETAALLRPAIGGAGRVLETDPAEDLPTRLRGDAGRLSQILFHLAVHGLASTPERAPVRLSLRPLGLAPDGRLRLRVAVEHGGPGDPRSLRRDLAAAGLSVCRGLAEACGGRLGRDPLPDGRGCVTWAVLDMWEAGDPAGNGLSVLVVDDDPVGRMLTAELLRRAGHRVHPVATGTEGVARATAAAFDAVVMDLHMPDLDGAQAIARIRACTDPERAAVPVVAVTADAGPEAAAALAAAGASAVLTKPFGPDALAGTLARIASAAPEATTKDAPAPAAAPSPPDPALVPPESLVFCHRESLGPAAVRELVDLFRDTTPERLEALEAGLAAGDARAVEDAAHALKGAAGVLGLMPLHALHAEMEADAACGDLEAVRATLDKARDVHARTLAALETLAASADA